MKVIKYKDGYKYQLAETYSVKVSVLPPAPVRHEYISLSQHGFLTIRKGYAWDGPSGPTIDTKNFMRGSLVHDALYQLIGEGLLSMDDREQADKELRRICLEDGMSEARAWWVYKAVRLFGSEPASNAEPEPTTAP